MSQNRSQQPLDVNIAAQVAATWSAQDKKTRVENIQKSLEKLQKAFGSAMSEMQKVRDFVGAPEKIIGNPNTKHGEIAEQVHVGVTRAWDVFSGREASAVIDTISRTGSVDYQVNGTDIQSKYINGIRNTLKHILEHGEKYPDLAKGDLEYHIPKDQYEQLQSLYRTGKIEGLSDKRIQTITDELKRFQELTGRDPGDVIKPGNTTYAEVQQGKIHQTLDSREQDIKSARNDRQNTVHTENSPSWEGFGNAAALGVAAGGGVHLTQALWNKFQEGKNPFRGDFTLSDWQDVGVKGATGAAQGGIAGGILYTLTNATDLAAPFAGAMVSGLMGIGDLVRQYHEGKISDDQFAELSLFIAADAAIVGLATVAGQALIPVPILGAFLGSVAGKLVVSLLKKEFQKSEQELINKIESRVQDALESLDAVHRQLISKLDQYFDNLEKLIQLAFNEENNMSLRLEASTALAESLGIDNSLILFSDDDLDKFMME